MHEGSSRAGRVTINLGSEFSIPEISTHIMLKSSFCTQRTGSIPKKTNQHFNSRESYRTTISAESE